MTARDVLARALFYEFTADPQDDNPPSWHVIAESSRDGWRRVADFVARMDGEKLEESVPPLYVNHPRTEPVPGDVMRRDGDDAWRMLGYSGDAWVLVGGTHEYETEALRGRPFRLLVNGETGQVVQ